MMPPKFREHVQRHIRINLESRSEPLRDIIQNTNANLVSRGLGMSGLRLGEIRKVLSEEATTRAGIIWDSIRAVHESLGRPPDDSLQGELSGAFDASFGQVERDLTSALDREKRGFPPHMSSALDLSPAFRHARAKAHAAIDLYVDSVASSASLPTSVPGSSNTFNFHGPVGAIQTGNNSVANVQQAPFSDDERETLITALTEAVNVVMSAPRGTLDATVLLGAAAEASEIVKAPSPDRSRLREVLDILSSAVQGIAGAGTAYGVLSSFLN